MGLNKKTALLFAAILTFGVGTLYLGITMKNSHPPKDPNDWDLLIFTQTWPITLCYSWKGLNVNHTCNFPSQKNLWTVHGIWPTKLGTIGPGYCNKSLKFNPDAIYGIKDKLNQYWTDLEVSSSNSIETNSSSINRSHKKESIYVHEWEKHGTCAVTLPSLNSEFKYFNQGVEWSEMYNMKDILEKSGIKINSTLNVSDYWKAIKSILKTNVWVQCEFKHDTKEQMLDEIRMCFDKSLNLINCDGIMEASRRGSAKTSHLLTNCDQKKPILYLDHVPERNTSTVSNATNLSSSNSNSTSNEYSTELFRSKRKVLENEWITKNPRSFNRSKSHQPQKNSSLSHNITRSNSYPYIERQEWDIIIFSQSWPYTFCHTWTLNSSTHICNLPANRNQWTIHGIWPTKIGTLGPHYCNNQTYFKLHELDSIIPELHNRWTEIQGSKTWTNKREGGLWKHEWNKHGTCLLSTPSLNSELKYFKRGLDWSKQYNLSELLIKGGIRPNGTYPIKKFWTTLRTGLGKNPRIDCYIEKNSNKVYIDEVRLCFDKSLSLVDCDHFRRDKNKPYTNCPSEQEIYYKGAVV